LDDNLSWVALPHLSARSVSGPLLADCVAGQWLSTGDTLDTDSQGIPLLTFQGGLNSQPPGWTGTNLFVGYGCKHWWTIDKVGMAPADLDLQGLLFRDAQTLTWYVASAVSITSMSDQQNTEGDAVLLQVAATDLNNLSLTYSAAGLPAGLSIDPQSGLISGTIAAGAANNGPYLTTITATDGTSTDAQTLTWNIGSPGSVQSNNVDWPVYKLPFWAGASGTEGTSGFFANQYSSDVPTGGQVLYLPGMTAPGMGTSNQVVTTTPVRGEQPAAGSFSFQANSCQTSFSGVADAAANIPFDLQRSEVAVLTQPPTQTDTDSAGQLPVNGAATISQHNLLAMQSSQLVLLPYIPGKADPILGEGEIRLPASHQQFLTDARGLQELVDPIGDGINASI
jgi:hypothetical protein